MENRYIFDLVDSILNYKLLLNFTAIQVVSYILIVALICQIVVFKSAGFLIYMLGYLNLNRFVINYQFISNDFQLFLFNLYLIVLLSVIYYFRNELKTMQNSTESFSIKIDNIIYGRLAYQSNFINYFLFIRACLLFTLDAMINFHNVLREKIKLLLIILIIFVLSSFFGSYEVLFFLLLISFIVESEKKKYRVNPIYKLRFDANIAYFKRLEMRTNITAPIKIFALQKANGWVDYAKEAAQNPRSIGGVAITVGGLSVGFDAYTTHAYNRQRLVIYQQQYADWQLESRRVTDDNLLAQCEWRESNTKGVPVQPVPIPLPAEPARPEYQHTAFGSALNGIFGAKK